jgi:hypothetical protein
MIRATAPRAVLLCVALLLPLASACDFEPGYTRGYQLLPAVALDTQVAFVEATNARAFLVDPARPEARVRMVEVGPDPVAAVRRRGKDQLLVLSRGERGEPGVAPEAPTLTVIDGAGAAPPLVLPLASRFNALGQSDDGRFVIAHFTPDASRAQTLFNPNEIAIVDLQAPSPAPVPRTIRSFGSVPAGVVFSPPMTLPDGPRTLAVVLSDNFVTILDLDNPNRPEITVPLTLPTDSRVLKPVQILFETRDPAIYVRAAGANDVYALRLLPLAAADRVPGGNDFTPALSQLAAGTGPSDMALFESAAGTRLLVVAPGSRDAFVIDARTSRSTRIPLDDAASRIHLFEAMGPGDAQARPRALLVGTGLESRTLGFLDLDQLELQGSRNLDSRPMGSPALEAHLFPARGLAVVIHRAQPSMPGVSVIDLSRRTVAPIFAEAPPARIAFGPAAPDKIWVGSESGNRLGFISLASLAPGEVRLDAPVAAVLPLARAADGKSRVVVVHAGSAAGHLTVLDADAPDRATARVIKGFLLQDLLERPER